ncbi:MAG: 50S ribosomal protein L16 [Parcubacteria group bacterium GW2011_GWA1_42_7]|nr:MAG: 50S ribosomal protein L16 [Parcubacteria group bacterium GW2011_GWB1_42_6]KKS69593.1 MAG: 50S ribosomal protein L16 [Parcubacteria group bacterium GW2011_GWA1_42_7]KKS92145.1 MAG: 50S ribosomal protein L16 [Parcubacteria group bacterium GW2011_GWC1_43_12]
MFPRKVKHRKWQKGNSSGLTKAGAELAFGSFGLKSLETCWLNGRQIEAARRAMTRYVQRGGRIWLRVFPDKPVTKKGTEVPMGGGKGSVEYYVAVIKPGRILFEMDGIDEKTAREALRLAAYKLPVKTRFIAK